MIYPGRWLICSAKCNKDGDDKDGVVHDVNEDAVQDDGEAYMEKTCDVAGMAILAKKIGGKSA